MSIFNLIKTRFSVITACCVATHEESSNSTEHLFWVFSVAGGPGAGAVPPGRSGPGPGSLRGRRHRPMVTRGVRCGAGGEKRGRTIVCFYVDVVAIILRVRWLQLLLTRFGPRNKMGWSLYWERRALVIHQPHPFDADTFWTGPSSNRKSSFNTLLPK